jgi:tripartite-type tricarboxylate transporter receptor subunit TctC
MNPSRRRFLQLITGAAAIPVTSQLGLTRAWAQAYPSRPIRLVAATGPGSAPDILARLIGQSLSERLGQPVVVENRPGAGSNIGTQAVVNAAPDGYTLLLIQPAAAMNATLYEKLSFDFLRDIAPVAGISRVRLVMLVNPAVPAKTVPELIAFAKANPGKLSMASPGVGTLPHVAGELFKMMAGVDMVHVPYKGAGPAMTDLLSGQVQVMFVGTPESIAHIEAGKVRALAVTTENRSELLPDIPPMSDALSGFEASAWFGIGAPRNTPPEIIDRLNQAINAGLNDAKTQARLAELGGAMFASSPGDFGKFLAAETEKWGKVIRAAGIKQE